MNENRSPKFQRNTNLEGLLQELNSLLAPANALLAANHPEIHRKIFILGALRSGTTLFTQWLASTGTVAYPTNLLSRFYGCPLVGAKIQLLLTDPRYNFRNEILDFSSEIIFSSENGKTKGALSPNEFWYFWRRFLPFSELDYMAHEDLMEKADINGLRDELNALANIFERPFMLKGMIMNQNIPILDSAFEKALFIWIKRDPVYNIQSALEARRRQYGNLDTWYSFKIREYPWLKGIDPLESVAGQIYAINSSIESDLTNIDPAKKLVISYEDFCKDPKAFFGHIADKCFNNKNYSYNGQTSFENTNAWFIREYSKAQVEAVYQRFQEYGLSSITKS